MKRCVVWLPLQHSREHNLAVESIAANDERVEIITHSDSLTNHAYVTNLPVVIFQDTKISLKDTKMYYSIYYAVNSTFINAE